MVLLWQIGGEKRRGNLSGGEASGVRTSEVKAAQSTSTNLQAPRREFRVKDEG